ncbi:MAG: methyltransferase domain-containing protein [Dehalococcoidales bacterium]
MSETTPLKPVGFACPKCKRPLRSIENALQCSECNLTYPIVGGIPDFLSENLLDGIAPNYRWIKMLEFLAPIYEGQLWHSFILKTLAGARSSSLDGIAGFVSDTLKGITGSVLDVACGPATYGRRIASPSRNVCGVDFSMGTLQQGMTNIARDGISGVCLARARVEELPFENAVFDGVICGGSLHLFPDTVLALREIARTMKASAPLAVTTFVAGNAALTRLMKRRKNMRVFQIPDLQQYLAEAGFEEFKPKLDGTFLMFSTRKAMPCI